MTTDYVPRQDGALINFLRTLVHACEKHRSGGLGVPVWDWIDGAELAALAAATQAFQAAQQRAYQTGARDDVEEKNLARAAAEALLRPFVRRNLGEDFIGAEGRIECALRVHKKRRITPLPVPETGPEGHSEISSEDPGLIRIRYKGGKPPGVIACQIGYVLAESFHSTPIEDPGHFTGIDTFTHNPWTGNFEGRRGSCLFYALRWLVSGGAVSPWTALRMVVVP